MYGAEVWQIPTTEINKIFIYRNGCAKKTSKKIKDGKNKKWTYKGNNGSEREAGYYGHHRDEKATAQYRYCKFSLTDTWFAAVHASGFTFSVYPCLNVFHEKPTMQTHPQCITHPVAHLQLERESVASWSANLVLQL